MPAVCLERVGQDEERSRYTRKAWFGAIERKTHFREMKHSETKPRDRSRY
jgi:hypothetical protein